MQSESAGASVVQYRTIITRDDRVNDEFNSCRPFRATGKEIMDIAKGHNADKSRSLSSIVDKIIDLINRYSYKLVTSVSSLPWPVARTGRCLIIDPCALN
jgi:hypothetical protein